MSALLRFGGVVALAIAGSSPAVGYAATPAADALITAVVRDDAGRATELLSHGIDPNTRNAAGQPALVLAVRERSPRVVEVLLAARGIDTEATNGAGETALMIAALKGDGDTLHRLIAKGAAVNRGGWTPLHYAASGPSTACVDALIAAGAIVDAPSPNHSTALMMAARYGPERSVDRLLAAGADPTAINDQRLDAAGFARDAQRTSLAARLARLEQP